jgi:NAD(P)-dependent dehydrogenase (short-subunit alcohol dehydrogenase family)
MKTLKDRVAVITGAGGGIGRALAAELASRGCHLALVDVNEAALAETAQVVSAYPVKVSQHVADVTDAERMARLPGEVVAHHGGVHLLINNAGITLQKSFATHSLADWQRVIGINLWGVIHGCHFFRDELLRADEAHVVNLSSMAAFLGLPSQSSYCATKSAVQGLSESLWTEWGVEGIGVTCVHPGAIRTDMIRATLEESDDVDLARRNYELAKKLGVDPDRAARKIVDGVVKGRMRVRIGKDAALLDWLKRLAPSAIHRPLRRLAMRVAAQ